MLGRRRTIESGDEGMIGMVVNGRVGWVSGAESSVLAFLAERGHCGRPQFRNYIAQLLSGQSFK